MTKILIRGSDLDPHVLAVQWGLAQLGVQADLWPGDVFPQHQFLTSRLYPAAAPEHHIKGSDHTLALEGYDRVWNRRPGDLNLPQGLTDQDKAFVTTEGRTALMGLTHVLLPDAFWVNPPHVTEASQAKTQQLVTAQKAGLTIPNTLISNDPEEVRDFYRQHDGRIIYKSFSHRTWANEADPAAPPLVGHTRIVPETMLKEEAAISAAPGIFQAAIPKAYELRVTAMGHWLTAGKIDLSDPQQHQDWRAAGPHIPIIPYDLPQETADKLRAYMDAGGLAFGCFDLIITPEGETVFLEVNQAGQFLWKEIAEPRFPLLWDFCHFLISGDRTFFGPQKPAQFGFQDFAQSTEGQALQKRLQDLVPAKQTAQN